MSTAAPSLESIAQPARTTSRGMNIALWVAQVLLAIAFGMAGAMKLFTPIAELAAKMPSEAAMPALIRFIGASELAGAIGLILPAATRILPRLTILAAAGLLVVMVLATAFHVWKGELSHAPVPIVLGAIAGFIVWGRARKAPIIPR